MLTVSLLLLLFLTRYTAMLYGVFSMVVVRPSVRLSVTIVLWLKNAR